MRLEIFIIHQNERFNKKMELLCKLFISKTTKVITFEDDENIIYLNLGYNHNGLFNSYPEYIIEKKK